MGYVHSYYQVKSVPNDQWLLLTTQVANVFLLTQNRHIPGYLDPMVLCTAEGMANIHCLNPAIYS